MRLKIAQAVWKVARLHSGPIIKVDPRELRLGFIAGVPNKVFSSITGCDIVSMMRMADSPHVALMRGNIDPYLHYSGIVCYHFGHYHGARTTEELESLASSIMPRPINVMPKLAMVAGTRGTYEIVDGHHRVASAIVMGEQEVEAEIVALAPSWLSWMVGKTNMTNHGDLYQPLDFPEVRGRRVVRQCSDRMGMILSCLNHLGIKPKTALDLGCSYGYFSRGLADAGARVTAVDADPNAIRLLHVLSRGYSVRGVVGRCDHYHQQADVVLFLSLLHHFMLGVHGNTTPVHQLVQAVATQTNRVLFVDSGEGHEAWFRKLLSGVTKNTIRDLFMETGQFTRCVDLGWDLDYDKDYGKNYGRTLWAFVKE